MRGPDTPTDSVAPAPPASPGRPVDPDAGGTDAVGSGPGSGPVRRRPVHLRVRWVLLVVLGGMIGTAVREALVLAFPAPAHGFPLTVFGINVIGAFVLGSLLEFLARRGPDQGARRAARLGLGTGVLGGFTTYSALAADTAQLVGPAPGTGLLYLAASVIVGTAAAWVGIAAAAAFSRRRERRRARRRDRRRAGAAT